MNSIEDFNSLIELCDYFSTEQKCIDYLIFQRWEGNIICPRCKNNNIYKYKDGKRLKCAECNKQFTVRTGTIFEDSNLPLRKWLIAYYLLLCHKKGISSYQLAKDIKVTQKTAWFVLHRIRYGLGMNEDKQELSGNIQLDESFVGGKNKNRHIDKKVKNSQGRSFKDKTPVMGMLQQQEIIIKERAHKILADKTVKEKVIVSPSILRCEVIPDTSSESIQPLVHQNVAYGNIVISDEWIGYTGLDRHYDHRIVDHTKKQFLTDQGDSTNGIEGSWTLLKRCYMGTYHYMSRKHLQKYVDEVVFRYNTKTMKEGQRFNYGISRIYGRLKYKRLICKL